MQVVFVLGAMFLGLLYNYNFTGFAFKPAICIFAGLFMVMPTLFKTQLSDFKIITLHKVLIGKNLLANFFILPLIAIGIGLLSGDFGIAAGVFLLSVMAGGGMVMHWIKDSNANTKIGFILFSLNILLLSVSFLMFKFFGIYLAPYYELNNYAVNTSGHIPWFGAFLFLVFFPFIASRFFLKFLPAVPKIMQEHRANISNVTIFLIVFYLFALENSKVLFEVEGLLFIKTFLSVAAFYGLTFITGKLIYNTHNKEERAAFWHLITRYITLALIMSTFSISTYGATLILPIMMAYFIQLPLSIYYNKSYK